MLAVSTGHAGLSGALRTVEPLPRWEVTAALPVIRSMTRVPARAMGWIMPEVLRAWKSWDEKIPSLAIFDTWPREELG